MMERPQGERLRIGSHGRHLGDGKLQGERERER